MAQPESDTVLRSFDVDRLVAWLLVLPPLAGVVAVRYYPWGLSGEYEIPTATLAISAIVALVALVFSRDLRSRVLATLDWAWPAVAVLFSVLALATVVSGNATEELFGTDTARGLLQLGALTLVGVCATGVAGRARRVLYTLAPVVLAIEVAVAIWSLALGQEARGTLENSVYFSQLVLLLAPVLLIPRSPAQKPAERIGRWALVWLAVLATGLAGSREGLALGALLLLSLLILLSLKPGVSVRTLAVRFGVAAVAIALLALAAIAGPWSFKFTSEFSGNWLFSYRTDYWKAAWDSFVTSPLIGHGPDSYWSQVVQLSRAGVVGFQAFSGDPHNVVLTVLQVSGLIGMGALAWIGFTVWRNWRGQGRSSVWLAAGLIAFLLTGLFEPLPLQVLPVFVLVLGASIASSSPAEDAHERSFRPLGIGVIALCGALSVYLVVLAGSLLLAWQPSSPDVQSATRAQVAADAVHFDAFLYATASDAWYYAAEKQLAPDAARKSVAAMQRANQLAQAIPSYAFQLARLYVDSARPASVVQAAFERALAIQPHDVGGLTDYARYLASTGQLEAARQQARTLASVAGTSAVPADLTALLGSDAGGSAP